MMRDDRVYWERTRVMEEWDSPLRCVLCGERLVPGLNAKFDGHGRGFYHLESECPGRTPPGEGGGE